MADKFQVAVAEAKNEFLKLWKEHINQLKDAAEGASTKEQKFERIVPLCQEFILAILQAISQGLKDSDDELHN